MLLKISDLNVGSILKNINISINEHEKVVLLGRNGAGKTTLIKAILGIIDYKGSIYFKDRNINSLNTYERAKLGIYTILQNLPNISYLKVSSLFRNADKNLLISHLKKLNIDESILSKTLDDSLSGGERKKIELIHALMHNPEFLILDEWDSGVDVKTQNVVINLLGDKSLMLVTHNPYFAKKIATKIYYIRNGIIISGDKEKMVEMYERAVD